MRARNAVSLFGCKNFTTSVEAGGGCSDGYIPSGAKSSLRLLRYATALRVTQPHAGMLRAFMAGSQLPAMNDRSSRTNLGRPCKGPDRLRKHRIRDFLQEDL